MGDGLLRRKSSFTKFSLEGSFKAQSVRAGQINDQRGTREQLTY